MVIFPTVGLSAVPVQIGPGLNLKSKVNKPGNYRVARVVLETFLSYHEHILFFSPGQNSSNSSSPFGQPKIPVLLFKTVVRFQLGLKVSLSDRMIILRDFFKPCLIF